MIIEPCKFTTADDCSTTQQSHKIIFLDLRRCYGVRGTLREPPLLRGDETGSYILPWKRKLKAYGKKSGYLTVIVNIQYTIRCSYKHTTKASYLAATIKITLTNKLTTHTYTAPGNDCFQASNRKNGLVVC